MFIRDVTDFRYKIFELCRLFTEFEGRTTIVYRNYRNVLNVQLILFTLWNWEFIVTNLLYLTLYLHKIHVV